MISCEGETTAILKRPSMDLLWWLHHNIHQVVQIHQQFADLERLKSWQLQWWNWWKETCFNQVFSICILRCLFTQKIGVAGFLQGLSRVDPLTTRVSSIVLLAESE